MKFEDSNKEKKNQEPEKLETIEKLRNLMQKNKSAALGLAVFLTLSTALTGCGTRNVEEEEDDDESYYVGGGGGYYGGYHGSYYYVRGGSYKEGSWGKSKSYGGYSGYSSSRGGSVGA